jgi:hypothetical protein
MATRARRDSEARGMTDNRGGPSSADVFDLEQRVYACAATVGKGKPQLHRVSRTWGVVHPLSGRSPTPVRLDWRAAAYAWCREQNGASVEVCSACGGAVRVKEPHDVLDPPFKVVRRIAPDYPTSTSSERSGSSSASTAVS